MGYSVTFTPATTSPITLSVDKHSRAKIVNEALKTAGIIPVITVNKTVDMNKPPRDQSPAQKAATEKRKAEAAAKKAAAEKAANKNKK
jgi:hypothetical protein